jgi:low affinity Fe/Cu permease
VIVTSYVWFNRVDPVFTVQNVKNRNQHVLDMKINYMLKA